MRMTAELFALQCMRLRRVLEHIGAHLDEDLGPKVLAEIACLSVSQFERLYHGKVGESPLATHRRLRLSRAREELRNGSRSVQTAAQAAGYASTAAFSHAYARLFGYAPSVACMSVVPPVQMPGLYLEYLPERPVFQLRYSGARRECRDQRGSLSGALAVAGARHWRNWSCLDLDHPLAIAGELKIDVIDFVPASGLPDSVRHVDRVCQPAGLYAVWHTLGYPPAACLPRILEQVRHELGCLWSDDQRLLLRDIKVNGYTVPQERRYALYIPVRRV